MPLTDLQNKTTSLKENFKHSATTGIVVGAISYNVGALFPEQAFQGPAIWATISAMTVNYAMPVSSAVTKAALTGAGMAVACMFITQNCPADGALRYGAASALAAYVADQYIVPRLMTVEREYI